MTKETVKNNIWVEVYFRSDVDFKKAIEATCSKGPDGKMVFDLNNLVPEPSCFNVLGDIPEKARLAAATEFVMDKLDREYRGITIGEFYEVLENHAPTMYPPYTHHAGTIVEMSNNYSTVIEYKDEIEKQGDFQSVCEAAFDSIVYGSRVSWRKGHWGTYYNAQDFEVDDEKKRISWSLRYGEGEEFLAQIAKAIDSEIYCRYCNCVDHIAEEVIFTSIGTRKALKFYQRPTNQGFFNIFYGILDKGNGEHRWSKTNILLDKKFAVKDSNLWKDAYEPEYSNLYKKFLEKEE